MKSEPKARRPISPAKDSQGDFAQFTESNTQAEPKRGGVAMWNEVFNLPEGAVTIQLPATLSRDSYDDLVDGLELFKRKIGRMVARAEAAKSLVSVPSDNETDDEG